MLLTPQDIEKLDSLSDNSAGYFGQMVQYLDRFIRDGLRDGRFTRQQAEEDLDIALWYSHAWNNLGGYQNYWRSAQWLPASEKNAKGSGRWYYRYATALMYCGDPERSLAYHRRGTEEEPGFVWNWLQVGRLLGHFGDKAGALSAVDRALALEPEDYEIRTTRREIEEGRPIWEMEFHYCDPEWDRRLREDDFETQRDKREAVQKRWDVAGIITDPEGLERNKAVMGFISWGGDGPRWGGVIPVRGREVTLWFRMNEAAFSRLDPKWLAGLRDWMETDGFLRCTTWREYRIREYEAGVDGCGIGIFADPETGARYINRSSNQPVPPPPFPKK